MFTAMKCKENGGLATAATYVAPVTVRTTVLTEGGICASGEEVKTKIDRKVIEVEEYASIENDISFD